MANFRRKNLDPNGIYVCAFKEGKSPETGQPTVEKEIKIEGRNIYSTDDKKEIEFLRKDPEIEEIDKKTKIEVENQDEE